MPLEQRVILPIYVSRGCFTLDSVGNVANNIPNELECVTNGTLANIIRQLSSLSRYAEDLFGCLLEEATTLVQRSANLKSRLDVLGERVERLDASNDVISLQDCFHQRKPFRSRADNFDQQVVARTTILLSLHEVYESCDPPPPLDKLNPFRDDNQNGLKLYTNPNYFFELWRKEMLADRSRIKVVKNKQGDIVHASGGKAKRKQVRHQGSTETNNNGGSPTFHSPAAHPHSSQLMPSQNQMSHVSSSSLSNDTSNAGQYAIYGENGVMMNANNNNYNNQQQINKGNNIPAQMSHYHAPGQQQQQQQIYYQQNAAGQPQMVMASKREEMNPSGSGTYTVVEGSYIDPNNYQHHYVQHQYHNQQQQAASQNAQLMPINSKQSNRPNSLELSHSNQDQQAQQQHYAPGQQVHPNQMDYYQYQQQMGKAQPTPQQQPQPDSYNQRASAYGSAQQQQQYPSPSANLTPTRRAAMLSRPSAPPPAPPAGSNGSSASNSGPSTPSHKTKSMNGQDEFRNVSRDSLPPPPPPPPNSSSSIPNGQIGMNSGHHDVPDTALPPPPPPPPPADGFVNSPPPPPPPPMYLLSGSNGLQQNNSQPKTPSSGTQFKPTSSKPTAEELLSVKLKKTSITQPEQKSINPRDNLLAAIKEGIKLKHVEESKARETEKTVPLHDVASILARRVAMELSDSEGEAEEEGDESDAWDDESEC